MRLATVIFTALIAVAYSIPLRVTMPPEPQTPKTEYVQKIPDLEPREYDFLIKFITNKARAPATMRTAEERRKAEKPTTLEEQRITKSLMEMLKPGPDGSPHKLMGPQAKVDFGRIKYEGYYDPEQLPGEARKMDHMDFFWLEGKKPGCALGCFGWVATARVGGKEMSFGEIVSVPALKPTEHKTVAMEAPDKAVWKKLHMKFEKDFLKAEGKTV
ncbi:hypothetical protein BDP27DRAFT_1427471 [Rhodocollybia butyracea]|uniref:Uncharacterized protein n=1 Tax=Rhodocollybia butyracea TaxID=206335 RepID=A0A9P5PC52_9AGAR|nr:hypothetical protein BDP27DRAFT_1427471 [Rhodocollybia butyracea]